MTQVAGGPHRLLRQIAVEHPAFQGHFPGHPVLPGVVLLAEVLEAVRSVPALAQLLGPSPLLIAGKFLAPVGPGSDLQIELRVAGRQLVFEVSVAATAVAKGQFEIALPPEPVR